MDGENRISRRRMLKRIGAGAAIAWSAPVLSSLRTPAFAQPYPPRCDDPCDDTCADGLIDVCGSGPGPGDTCHCSRADDGSCQCWDNFFCANSFACGNGGCPPGCFCIRASGNCCGVDICACPCGSGKITSQGTGPTAGRL